jgi:hypothetical protein
MNYLCVSGMLLIAAIGIAALINRDEDELMAIMLLEIGLLSFYAIFIK